MIKSDTIGAITAAIIEVMKEVKGIEKSMTIGTGNNSYKGVPDKEVKKLVGDSMARNGLAIIPTAVEADKQIDRWEETGGQYGPKQKQSIFTEVHTKYLLLHTSGEYLEIAGYGHGVDNQDKGAGKATTYALKYALLYTFLVPTGKIDDSDNIHNDDIKTPDKNKKKALNQVQWAELLERVKTGDFAAAEKAANAFALTTKQTEEITKLKSTEIIPNITTPL